MIYPTVYNIKMTNIAMIKMLPRYTLSTSYLILRIYDQRLNALLRVKENEGILFNIIYMYVYIYIFKELFSFPNIPASWGIAVYIYACMRYPRSSSL